MPVFHRTTRYVLGLLFWPFLLVSASLTGIIWLMQALRFVDFIINRGLSVTDFLYLTALILPALLSLILPIAVLIAVVFTYHKLYTESELVVMQASGMSRLQLARPAMVAGLLVTGATYLFTLYLLPLANRQFEDMRDFLRDNYASVLLQEEVFNHPVDGMTVFIRERSDTGKLKGVLVHDNRDPDTTTTMMADEATLVQTPSGPRFLLENGIRQEKRNGRLSWLNFASYSLDLSYYTKRNLNRERAEDEMFVSELLHERHAGTEASARYRAEAHERLVWPWSGFALSLLAVAIMTEGQFNRRGIAWRLVVVGAVSLVGVLGIIGLQNTLTKHAALTPVLYGYVAAMVLVALLLLSGWKQRLKKPVIRRVSQP
jgi:lipopolysaccharide export system permease protein